MGIRNLKIVVEKYETPELLQKRTVNELVSGLVLINSAGIRVLATIQ
jgi:hypothetical protein